MNDADATKWIGLIVFWFLNAIGIHALFSPTANFLPWHYYVLFYSMPLFIYYKGKKGYTLRTIGFDKVD